MVIGTDNYPVFGGGGKMAPAFQAFCFQYKVNVVNIDPAGKNIKIGDRVIVDFDKEKFPYKWAQVIEVL